MDKLALNEKLEISAPHGRIEYLDDGDFKINPLIKNKRPDLFKGIENVCLIAVGTGITPMWQMLEAILSNSTGNFVLELFIKNYDSYFKTKRKFIWFTEIDTRRIFYCVNKLKKKFLISLID